MDDRHRPVGPVDRPQQGKGDGVVSTERNDPRQGLALLCRAQLVSIRGWVAREDGMVALFDLMKSPRVVIPREQVCQHKIVHVYTVKKVLTKLRECRRNRARKPSC